METTSEARKRERLRRQQEHLDKVLTAVQTLYLNDQSVNKSAVAREVGVSQYCIHFWCKKNAMIKNAIFSYQKLRLKKCSPA